MDLIIEIFLLCLVAVHDLKESIKKIKPMWLNLIGSLILAFASLLAAYASTEIFKEFMVEWKAETLELKEVIATDGETEIYESSLSIEHNDDGTITMIHIDSNGDKQYEVIPIVTLEMQEEEKKKLLMDSMDVKYAND